MKFPHQHPDYLKDLQYSHPIARLKVRWLQKPYPTSAVVIHDPAFNAFFGLTEEIEFVPFYGNINYLVNPEYGYKVSLKRRTLMKYWIKDHTSDRLTVRYRQEGKKRADYAHKVVWTAINGPVPEGCELHHRDGKCARNGINNLQLVTKEDHRKIERAKWQQLKAFAKIHGTSLRPPEQRCAEVDSTGNILREFPSLRAAARATGGKLADIEKHLAGRRETFAGGKWIAIDHDGTRLGRMRPNSDYVKVIMGKVRRRRK